ncbi:hypothetical protein GQ85_17405 [Rhodococcus rhodochrous]|nr:hypothetical protein GQ85_17405 [Rhodococcus rhodochrous]
MVARPAEGVDPRLSGPGDRGRDRPGRRPGPEPAQPGPRPRVGGGHAHGLRRGDERRRGRARAADRRDAHPGRRRDRGAPDDGHAQDPPGGPAGAGRAGRLRGDHGPRP